MDYDFSKHIKSIEPYINYVSTFNKIQGMEFEKCVDHKNLPIHGRIDGYVESDSGDALLLELKFTKCIDLKHIFQCIFYSESVNSIGKVNLKTFEIWNFLTGERMMVKYDILRWQFNKFFAKILECPVRSQTFIVVNNKIYEFTSLIETHDNPSEINKNCVGIKYICHTNTKMVGVNSDGLKIDCSPVPATIKSLFTMKEYNSMKS
jgi:hypothetical protein